MRRVRLRVKDVAQQQNMSMTKLHKQSDVAYTTIRTVFRNPYEDGITLHTLVRLAEALNVPTGELLEDEEE
jgi:DNA-binding Xre family transcriptional regulator